MNTASERRIDWWNIVFTAFFVFLVYVAFRIVTAVGLSPHSISLWDTTLMALAAFRLTRLFVYDTIMAWFRDFFAGGKPMTFVGTIKTLVNCPWCMGLWFALVVATAYFVAPVIWFFMFVLALAGLTTLLQLLANLIGWNAELKKRRALALEADDAAPQKCG